MIPRAHHTTTPPSRPQRWTHDADDGLSAGSANQSFDQTQLAKSAPSALVRLLLEQIAETDADLTSCPALRLVPYADILGYLARNGWRPTRGYAADGFDYFWHPQDTGSEAHIMGTALDRSNFRPDALPYGNAEFVNEIARVHQRPAFATLAELLAMTPAAAALRAAAIPESSDSRFANRESLKVDDLRVRIRQRLDEFGDDPRIQLARAAIGTVLDDHTPESVGAVLGPDPLFYCLACSCGYDQVAYPCPPLLAIARELGIEAEHD